MWASGGRGAGGRLVILEVFSGFSGSMMYSVDALVSFLVGG